MNDFPDRTGHSAQTVEEEVNTPESVLHRLREERSRGGPFQIFAWRVPWPVIVGALVILLLALAFSFLRPGSAGEGTATPAPTKPAATAAPAAPAAPAAASTPAARPTPSAVASQERIHTVVSGDTLGLLAEKYYGDPSKYTVIFEANQDILEDPDTLQLGQELKIPD